MLRAKLSVENSCCGDVERAGRQQIDLTGERRAGEEIGRAAARAIRSSRAEDAPAPNERSSSGRRREAVSSGTVASFRIAAARVTQPPRDLAVIVVDAAGVGGRRRRRRPQVGRRRRGSVATPTPAASIGYDERLPGVAACRSAIDEDARALGRTSTIWPRDATNPLEMRAHQIRPGRQRPHLETAAAIGDRERRRRAERRHHRARDRRALLVLNDALDRARRRSTPRA